MDQICKWNTKNLLWTKPLEKQVKNAIQNSKVWQNYNKAFEFVRLQEKCAILPFHEKEEGIDLEPKTWIEDLNEFIPKEDNTDFYVKPLIKDSFYITLQTKTVEMKEGFLPIQFLIYDIMELKMHNLAKKLQNKGATIYGIKKILCLLILIMNTKKIKVIMNITQ